MPESSFKNFPAIPKHLQLAIMKGMTFFFFLMRFPKLQVCVLNIHRIFRTEIYFFCQVKIFSFLTLECASEKGRSRGQEIKQHLLSWD